MPCAEADRGPSEFCILTETTQRDLSQMDLSKLGLPATESGTLFGGPMLFH